MHIFSKLEIVCRSTASGFIKKKVELDALSLLHNLKMLGK